MFNIVLFQPEIPPNTGNIMRLCANTHCALHLIEPLGFELTDKHLKRAGLDYILPKPFRRYSSFEEYLSEKNPDRIFLCSSKANTWYTKMQYEPEDSFIFGPETRGLPSDLLQQFPDEQKITIPMRSNSRSLNLSNAVAVIVYEAWRQQEFGDY